MFLIGIMVFALLVFFFDTKPPVEGVHAAGLKDLFKRKPGGTTVGKLVRSVASKVTGIDMSNFLMLKPGENPDAQQATREVVKQVVRNTDTPYQDGSGGGDDNADAETRGLLDKRSKIMQWLFPRRKGLRKAKWYEKPGVWIIIVVTLGIILIIWKPWKKRKKGGRA